jgi:pyridoxamine 5'-phosphate oxidase
VTGVAVDTGSVDVVDLASDPLVQLARWHAEALPHEPDLFTPMVLATAGGDGAPSARTVLLKEVDDRGVVFFTNRESRKGREIAANPRACAVLRFRQPRHRQVVVAGGVEVLEDAASDAYFATRPRGSQLAAWASPQSEVIESREVLEARVAEVAARFAEPAAVPRPPHWGGYRIVPDTVELWEDRPDRLHDRARYRRTAAGPWVIERLAP